MGIGFTVFQKVTFEALQSAALERHLTITGALHPARDDRTPPNTKTLLLLSPNEPHFWPRFKASPEYTDGQDDPLDRYSKRIVTPWALDLKAQAFFPSDGPPYPAFIHWALRSDRAWVSPVGLLVHDTAGLFISYRAALTLPYHVALPGTGQNPCDTCADKPCLTTCPANALTADGYDVPKCKTYLNSEFVGDCMETGCCVRRACQISQKYGRLPQQSAFHMAAFNHQ